jgi:hypothetical protein
MKIAIILALAVLAPLSARADGDAEFTALQGKRVMRELKTKDGFQIYSCKAGKWTLHEAKAKLIDQQGNEVGEHFFVPKANKPGELEPAWRLDDGSYLTGKKVGSKPSDQGVDLLAIQAASNNGKGSLGTSSDVQRLDTIGGKPPTTPCNAGAVDIRVRYSARYVFLDRFTEQPRANAVGGPAAPKAPGSGGAE